MRLTARSVVAALRPGFALTLIAKNHRVDILVAREGRFHGIHFASDGRAFVSAAPMNRDQLVPWLESSGFPLGSRCKHIHRSDQRNFPGFKTNPGLLNDEQRAAQHAAVKEELRQIEKEVSRHANL